MKINYLRGFIRHKDLLSLLKGCRDVGSRLPMPRASVRQRPIGHFKEV